VSKTQHRLISEELELYIGKNQYLDFVAHTGQVFRVKILQEEDGKILTRNALGHKKAFTKSDLKEIWIDKKARIA